VDTSEEGGEDGTGFVPPLFFPAAEVLVVDTSEEGGEDGTVFVPLLLFPSADVLGADNGTDFGPPICLPADELEEVPDELEEVPDLEVDFRLPALLSEHTDEDAASFELLVDFEVDDAFLETDLRLSVDEDDVEEELRVPGIGSGSPGKSAGQSRRAKWSRTEKRDMN
jgi:hypothetical protein